MTARGYAFSRSSAPAAIFFYLFTGLHAAHLLVGVAAILFCLGALGWFKRVEIRQIAVDVTAWYWYAMSLLWLVLFTVLALGE